MPNHLFVNSRHYQDRPDSTMRYRIASHAARYGPNGSIASKSPPPGTDETTEESTSGPANWDTASSSQSGVSTPKVRPASLLLTTSWHDAVLPQDYSEMLIRCSALCICSAPSSERQPGSLEGRMGHSGDCLIPDKWYAIVREHELPFRVTGFFRRSAKNTSSDPMDSGLVLQCLLMVGQASFDSLSPNFRYAPSDQTLRLQHKALKAMQTAITKRQIMIDDNIVIASALMLSIAAFHADRDAYRAHSSSLQRLMELRGGFDQTRAYAIVKGLMSSSEVSLAYHRYRLLKSQDSTTGKNYIPISTQLLSQPPVKLRHQMPPFLEEITTIITGMSTGFQTLAKSSRLSVQAMHLLHLVCRWSAYIEQPIGDGVKNLHALSETPRAITCQRALCDESVQTKRMAALLLISLPMDSEHASLERCLCLGVLNLLHSVTLLPHPIPFRDLLVTDFIGVITSLIPKDCNEQDFVIWSTLAVASEWRHCAAKMQSSPLSALHDYNTSVLSQIWLDKSKQLMDWLLVKHERATGWNEIQRICAKFLWFERLGAEWKVIWKEAMDRQSRNTLGRESRG